ncbi:MAG: HEAT repeat domain-containing protein [Gemmatimonadota bacterium]|nr:HEAT repeat domain-containing protein [Gemmatimonadota bacterium]
MSSQSTETSPSYSSDPAAYSTPDSLVQEFACRGLVLLSPDSLGISSDTHKRVYDQEKEAYLAGKPVTPGGVPAILEVLNAPGLVAACNQLVGENWAIVPFTHNASFTSGGRDQHWHKDDNGPYNGRKQRHHQAVQIEMLYYPQPVKEDMGPTATIPYSHSWTLDHEENNDNFAGADHLDFEFMLSSMESEAASGPESKYDIEDIINQRTAHDIRMREAVTDTGWPLVKQFEAAPLRAGTVLLYSHNTFHRGNHRRDDWRTWKENPRFMWRFWLYRTTDTTLIRNATVVEMDWKDLDIDPLTGTDLRDLTDDVTEVWRYHNHWLQAGQSPSSRPLGDAGREAEAERLFSRLFEKHVEGEPARIGAAYKLASIGDASMALRYLTKALYDERENVRRAATYGLIAVGSEATDTFLSATGYPVKWVRKAGVYGLGDVSHLTEKVLDALILSLKNDPSVYVRSVAAGSLGCIGRRAIVKRVGTDLIPRCFAALIESLTREQNRLCMSRAQGRSIKFVRPTDDCDICEGVGIDLGLDRFEPVRSAVRENALWSVVILCSHGTDILGTSFNSTVDALKTIVKNDPNVFDVGYAMDALVRLSGLDPGAKGSSSQARDLREELPDILSDSPVYCWEALVRGGLMPGDLIS